MANLHVNIRAGKKSLSAKYEVMVTAGTNLASTAVTEANGGTVELYSTAAHVVSIGAAPNALTDSGRFFLPPNWPVCIEGVAKGMKIAAATITV